MEIRERVEQALESIRPYLETDGGNVSIEEITAENVVKIKLLGSCASCAMSIMTFKAGLEQAIKKAVPEITTVEAINITEMDDPKPTMPDRKSVGQGKSVSVLVESGGRRNMKKKKK